MNFFEMEILNPINFKKTADFENDKKILQLKLIKLLKK